MMHTIMVLALMTAMVVLVISLVYFINYGLERLVDFIGGLL